MLAGLGRGSLGSRLDCFGLAKCCGCCLGPLRRLASHFGTSPGSITGGCNWCRCFAGLERALCSGRLLLRTLRTAACSLALRMDSRLCSLVLLLGSVLLPPPPLSLSPSPVCWNSSLSSSLFVFLNRFFDLIFDFRFSIFEFLILLLFDFTSEFDFCFGFGFSLLISLFLLESCAVEVLVWVFISYLFEFSYL